MNKKDIEKNGYMLTGQLAEDGYDWWWHSFTAYHHKTGEAKQFYIEFFVINPKLSPNRPIYGQIPGRKKLIRPSYVMVNVGTWGENKKQLHRFFPTRCLQADTTQLYVRAGDCFLSERETFGFVEVTKEQAGRHPEYLSDAGSMRWNLTIQKKVAFNVGYGTSRPLRTLNAFDMSWHAQGMKTEFEGNLIFDGQIYDVIPEKSYGYADKNWGSDFTSPWVWLSSCHMKSLLTGAELKNTVFDIGGGRPVAFGIPLERKLLANLWYEGEDLEFNFSKFWTAPKSEFSFEERADIVVWKVAFRNLTHVLYVECRCKKADMLKMRYESPDGRMDHKNLWNGGNGYGVFTLYRKCGNVLELVDKVGFKNTGCEYGE